MRVVVVGAGFAGLSTAVRLAKVKHEVILLEVASRVGGRLRRLDGRWALAPESFTLPGVVRDLFRKSGRPLERHLELAETGPRLHVFKPGPTTERLELPFGRRGDQHDAVTALTGGDEWSAWLDSLDPWWDPLRRRVLERVLPGLPERELRSALRLRRSLDREIHAALSDERLRRIVLDPPLLDGDDPRRVPAVAALTHLIERRFGRWQFVDENGPIGLEPLADVLEKRLGERRITVHTDVAAHDIRAVGRRVIGVTSSMGDVDADHVVWCAPAWPGSLPKPTIPHRTPPPLSLVSLSPGRALPHDAWVHADAPVHVWSGAPGHWSIAHRGSTDPLDVLADAGLDVRDGVIARRELSPDELLRHGHHGWEWTTRRWRSGSAWAGSGWASLRARPGVAPPRGLTFAGAHAHLGPSLELIGLTTASQAAHLKSD